MKHDEACELASIDSTCRTCDGWRSPFQPHCHCGSRAFPLCPSCRDGRHLTHVATIPATGKRCSCDLCQEAA